MRNTITERYIVSMRNCETPLMPEDDNSLKRKNFLQVRNRCTLVKYILHRISIHKVLQEMPQLLVQKHAHVLQIITVYKDVTKLFLKETHRKNTSIDILLKSENQILSWKYFPPEVSVTMLFAIIDPVWKLRKLAARCCGEQLDYIAHTWR